MKTPVIGFIPPIVGVENEFNTVRLGLKLSKTLQIGDDVFLMDEKQRIVFGKAEVTDIQTGQLCQLCLMHGAKNHSEIGKTDPENSPARLLALVKKIYGPHIAKDDKKSTIVYLIRRNDEPDNRRHDAVRQIQGLPVKNSPEN